MKVYGVGSKCRLHCSRPWNTHFFIHTIIHKRFSLKRGSLYFELTFLISLLLFRFDKLQKFNYSESSRAPLYKCSNRSSFEVHHSVDSLYLKLIIENFRDLTWVIVRFVGLFLRKIGHPIVIIITSLFYLFSRDTRTLVSCQISDQTW